MVPPAQGTSQQHPRACSAQMPIPNQARHHLMDFLGKLELLEHKPVEQPGGAPQTWCYQHPALPSWASLVQTESFPGKPSATFGFHQESSAFHGFRVLFQFL